MRTCTFHVCSVCAYYTPLVALCERKFARCGNMYSLEKWLRLITCVVVIVAAYCLSCTLMARRTHSRTHSLTWACITSASAATSAPPHTSSQAQASALNDTVYIAPTTNKLARNGLNHAIITPSIVYHRCIPLVTPISRTSNPHKT
jgi:hypothetical protein